MTSVIIKYVQMLRHMYDSHLSRWTNDKTLYLQRFAGSLVHLAISFESMEPVDK
jgi:hypothetical protein